MCLISFFLYLCALKYKIFKMATLEKIRNKAGLVVSIVGLALFAFIIGDLLNSSSSFMNRNMNNVLVVNGNAIDYQDYMNRENELTERYKLQYGITNPDENAMSQIRQAVYDDILMEKIIEPRLDNLGIVITTQEMTDMVDGENISPLILQNQLFQNPETGMFDRYAVNMILNQIKNIDLYPEDYQSKLLPYKMMWSYLEKDIKRNRLYEKYTSLLSKAVATNSLDAKDAFDNSSVSSDIAYVMESLAGIADSTVNVSAAEIEKLYNQRKEMFRQRETCVIDYIAVDILPSQSDYEQASKDMDAIRAELETTDNIAALVNEKSERKFSNAFYSAGGFNDADMADFVTTAAVGDIEGPLFKDSKYRIMHLVEKTENADSVFVFEILLAPRATEPETKAYADSVLNVINEGADFSEIAQQYSIDQGAQNGGEMGWITESVALQMINEEFKKTVFSLPAGKSAIVKSNYGLHIVKVTERTKNVPKYKVADMVYTVTPSSATRSQLYNALNRFIGEYNTVEKIEESAREFGYALMPNVRVYSTDNMVGSVASARQVVRWAFNNKKGDVSEIMECDNSFIVATHKGRLPEGYQSLASVTPQLKSELAARKKGEEMAARLKSKNLSTLSDYAEEMGARPDTVKFITMATSRLTGIGPEPKLNALITLSPLNKVSEPVVGNSGIYIFEVTNRSDSPDAITYDKENQIRMMEDNNAYRIGGLAFRFMQQNAKIEDNRIRFY